MALPPYVIDNNPFQGAFNALGQGIDAYGQAVGQARKRQQGQMVTNALARRDYAGAMSATDSPEMALNIHRQMSADRADARQEGMYGIEKSQRLAQLYGGVAQLVQSEKDPARAAAMWRRVVSAQPEFAGELRKYGIDPGDHSGGAAFLVAQAAGYRDPMESRIKAAQLASADVSRRSSELDMRIKERELNAPQAGKITIVPEGGTAIHSDPRTGESRVVATGGPKALKDHETKDAMWAERLIRSDAAIASVAGIGADGKPLKGAYNPAQSSNNFWPDSGIMGMANSRQWQQYQQAAREGIAAILRKDTGAAVTQEEWNLYFPMLYPQPGDKPDVVAQKARARQATAQALRAASGPAYDRMFPAGQASAAPQTSAPQGAPEQRATLPNGKSAVKINGQWFEE